MGESCFAKGEDRVCAYCHWPLIGDECGGKCRSGVLRSGGDPPVSRLAVLLDFLAETRDITHPDGCVAFTGYYDDAQRLAWSTSSRCPYSHPATMRGLRVQYARRGWSDQ